jgi:carbon-monoxide dehydrogenase medium subunit
LLGGTPKRNFNLSKLKAKRRRDPMSLYLRRLLKFEYLEPHTIREACSMANQYKEDSKFLAGGTDLLVQMKNRRAIPKFIIGFKNIPELDFIEHDKTKGLRIGPLTTLQSIVTSPIIKEKCNNLCETTSNMASFQIRNLAIIGGNICNGAPPDRITN